MIEVEGEFKFDFSKSLAVTKLDDKNKKLPQGMQLVDFVVDEVSRKIFIEIKDPSCKPKGHGQAAEDALKKQRQEFVKKICNDELISAELIPKARDSYCYLHLMELDNKPIIYAFLLGADKLTLDPAMLLGMKDRLMAKILQEVDSPWKKKYISNCIVVTEKTWSTAFPEYKLDRI